MKRIIEIDDEVVMNCALYSDCQLGEDLAEYVNITELASTIAQSKPYEEPRDNFDLGYVKGLKDGKDKLIKELWNCRNELCLRCGKYEKAHRGACDDCRYNFKNMKQYKRGDDE